MLKTSRSAAKQSDSRAIASGSVSSGSTPSPSIESRVPRSKRCWKTRVGKPPHKWRHVNHPSIDWCRHPDSLLCGTRRQGNHWSLSDAICAASAYCSSAGRSSAVDGARLLATAQRGNALSADVSDGLRSSAGASMHRHHIKSLKPIPPPRQIAGRNRQAHHWWGAFSRMASIDKAPATNSINALLAPVLDLRRTSR